MVRAGVYDPIVLGVVRDAGWNRSLVGLDRRRTRLALFGNIVVRVLWHVEVV
jgi:hypothetical protein